jgi:glycosyltransferase involved in cell wall biosynthesis
MLILTQKVDKNDAILGFFHSWIIEFAKNYEKVTVICLYEGEHNLPNNVKVLSLGKDELSAISYKLRAFFRFYKYIWKNCNEYDRVFVHMNPIYVVLGGLFWRLRGNRLALWYTHKNIDLKLRIAEKITNVIFSASKESFLLRSKKLKIVGHGIDVDKYQYKNVEQRKYTAVCVGRISPIKNQKLLVEAVDVLVNEKGVRDLRVALVGGFFDFDDGYYKSVKDFVDEKGLNDNITFIGSVPNNFVHMYYYESNISVNLAPTGGLDKVVLESLLCGTPAIALNKTFVNILRDDKLILKNDDKNELADKIFSILKEGYNNKKELSDFVRENYSVVNLIKKIKQILN